MKKYIYAGVLGCILATGTAIAADPETAIVPEHRWVDVENPLDGDDHCSIDYGDKVSLVAREGSLVILKVLTGGGGALCWRGAMFYADYDDFSTMTERYESIRKQKDERAAKFDRMLRNTK